MTPDDLDGMELLAMLIREILDRIDNMAIPDDQKWRTMLNSEVLVDVIRLVTVMP